MKHKYHPRPIRTFVGRSLAVGVLLGAELTRRFIQYARPPKPPAPSRTIIWPKKATPPDITPPNDVA